MYAYYGGDKIKPLFEAPIFIEKKNKKKQTLNTLTSQPQLVRIDVVMFKKTS